MGTRMRLLADNAVGCLATQRQMQAKCRYNMADFWVPAVVHIITVVGRDVILFLHVGLTYDYERSVYSMDLRSFTTVNNLEVQFCDKVPFFMQILKQIKIRAQLYS